MLGGDVRGENVLTRLWVADDNSLEISSFSSSMPEFNTNECKMGKGERERERERERRDKQTDGY